MAIPFKSNADFGITNSSSSGPFLRVTKLSGDTPPTTLSSSSLLTFSSQLYIGAANNKPNRISTEPHCFGFYLDTTLGYTKDHPWGFFWTGNCGGNDAQAQYTPILYNYTVMWQKRPVFLACGRSYDSAPLDYDNSGWKDDYARVMSETPLGDYKHIIVGIGPGATGIVFYFADGSHYYFDQSAKWKYSVLKQLDPSEGDL